MFLLELHSGYPSAELAERSRFKLRLGLHCQGGSVCFRDLYELMDWEAACPPERALELADGFYHVTLASNPPPSGVLGDHQTIHFFLQKLDAFPRLGNVGVPTLCWEPDEGPEPR